MIDQVHDNLDVLRNLDKLPGIKHVYVDTPGWIDLSGADDGTDVLGTGSSTDALRAVLEVADLVIVPIEPEPLCLDPTARTIKQVIEPLGKKFIVVVNNWDPRDGKVDLEQTCEFVRMMRTPCSLTSASEPSPVPTSIPSYAAKASPPSSSQVWTQTPPSREQPGSQAISDTEW